VEIVQADSHRRWFQLSILPLKGPDGAVSAVSINLKNITKRRETEIALQDSEDFLASVIAASPVGIITTDETGSVLTFSAAAERTFQYSAAEIKGRNIRILMPEPDRSAHDDYIRRYLDTGEAHVIGRPRMVRAKRKNGDVFPARLHVSEFHDGQRVFVAFIFDMTDEAAAEKRLAETQAQLQHAGRLSALGEMATSIAHEINQPLTAAASLAGAAALLLARSRPDIDEARPMLDDAVGEIRRASEIIRNMRDFVKKRKTARRRQDVNKVVEDAAAISLIGASDDGIEVSLQLGQDVGLADFDRLQIQQVLANLIRNAVDAMKGAPHRRLNISTIRRNGSVEISVADTGCGVPDEMKARIFEPFVSGKEDGVGVGLSISRSIIDAHQGEILFADNTPSGAVFTVRLPDETR
jgi:two-component system sensor kinase FixL